MQPISIEKVANEAEFNRFHGLILFWCALIVIFDGYDLAVVGAALPAIMDDMQIDPAKAGIMAGSALIGSMFGAVFLGTLADRVGRTKVTVMCIALFSIFTAAAGLTRDPVSFSVLRFVAGLGIGGVMPIMAAQMGEFFPLRLRTRLVSMVFAGFSIGGILVALLAKQFIQAYGWPSVFYAAGLPVLLLPFILKGMPESMAFLARQGRRQDLLAILRRIAPQQHIGDGAEIAVGPADGGKQNAPVGSLFREGRGWSTVMIWLAFITGMFMVYALNAWLTKLMAMAGYSLGSALNFLIVFNVGSILGAAVGGWLGDKLNIKYVLVGFYVLGAVSLTALAYTKATALLFVAVLVVGASTLGTTLLAIAYASDFYPAAIRSTGVGFAAGFGRIGAVLAPMLIGWLVSLQLPLEQNFMAIGLAGIVGAVAVMLVHQGRADSELAKQAAAGVLPR
ncbi:MFS transporter [Pseudorhodoferax sp.]|uniref:MFS transporter n=1 Tax=Pseudorhodoferax sp. TaxID=1993553 RepID=UPI0039E3E708